MNVAIEAAIANLQRQVDELKQEIVVLRQQQQTNNQTIAAVAARPIPGAGFVFRHEGHD